jgi:hypothetical protein
MKVAAPLATTFIAYTVGGLVSVFSLKKAKLSFQNKQYRCAILFVFLLVVSGGWMLFHSSGSTLADNTTSALFVDPLGPNQPIGNAKGICPGRVVWVHNPKSTNENCDPDKWGDGYFLDKNCDQTVVNRMVSDALRELVGVQSDAEAWDALFRFFNKAHGKGDVGYSPGENIFIKVNSVHAWNTDSQGNIPNNADYGNVDTSPQVVYAMLDQLVRQAGVGQNMISVGDPYTQMYNHCYAKWSTDFKDVHYVTRQTMTGREIVTKKNMKTIYYSDKGSVLSESTDQLVDCISQADYVLNIPLRDQYHLYRVFVDLLASPHLGGKTLLFLMDGPWGTSEEHLPPAKFKTAPFHNDYTSSIMASLDPVAVESVCLDILQKEFQVEDLAADPPRNTFVQWNAIDDYLHQPAGTHQFVWNGQDAQGRHSPSGVYLYRFQIRGNGWEDVKCGEMMLMR